MKYFLTIIIVFSSVVGFGQSYRCTYDILQETLTLKGDSFVFQLIDPIDPNKSLSGLFEERGDTLIFSPRVAQKKCIITSCNITKQGTADHIITFLDQHKKPLRMISIVIDSITYLSDMDGSIRIQGAFPGSLKISIEGLDPDLWACPYAQSYQDIHLTYEKKEGNHLIIQFDISQGFKKPFEYEIKLLKEGKRLYHLRDGRKIGNLFYEEVNIDR